MKFKGFIIAFALAFIVCAIITFPTCKKPEPLSVNNGKLENKNGDIIILRGVSLGWHNWWPRFYNAKVLEKLHDDWNCSVVRLAMGVDTENGYFQDPEWSKGLIETTVNAAVKEGLYVIIDWHSSNIYLKEAKSFFSEMATKYGKYPNIIYEIFNEPDDEKWNEIKAYSIDLISTIRKIDPDNIILVGTPQCDQYFKDVENDPIIGFKNIMYSLHFYADSHKQLQRGRAIHAILKGLPLFVSECSGTKLNGDGNYNYEEMNDWFNFINQAELSWVVWSVSDKNETSAFLKPGVDSFGSWGKGDLKDSGNYTRSLLRSYRTDKKMWYVVLGGGTLILLILWFKFNKKE